jgi:hypothetical protein
LGAAGHQGKPTEAFTDRPKDLRISIDMAYVEMKNESPAITS